MLTLKRKNLLIGGLALLVIMAMLALVAAPRVLAWHEPVNELTEDNICHLLDGYVTNVFTAPEEAIQAEFGSFGEGTVLFELYLGSEFGHNIFIVLKVSKEVSPGEWQLKYLLRIGGCEGELPDAPAIFLSNVCEPIDGFSSDGWQTWDSDSDEPLYVAASAEGPWHLTEYAQPPYVIGTEAAAGLTSWMGAASYGDLWFKAGPSGYAVNVGSAVADRAGNMDAICGN